jgi:hypothetical protein
MNSYYRSFGGLMLLCVAGFALLGAGCGSGKHKNKSSQPLDITAGTWTLTVTPSGGGNGGGSLTATFTTFPCSDTNISLGPTWTIPGPLDATVCFTASSLNITSGGGTAQGLIIGVGANPVPANGTTSMATNTSYFAMQDKSGSSQAFDLTGTFTASGQSLSGTYTCDTSSEGTCSGESGTLSGTMN